MNNSRISINVNGYLSVTISTIDTCSNETTIRLSSEGAGRFFYRQYFPFQQMLGLFSLEQL